MKSRGFTLIELMIVVAIIGILTAVAVPKFAELVSMSKLAERGFSQEDISKARTWCSNNGKQLSDILKDESLMRKFKRGEPAQKSIAEERPAAAVLQFCPYCGHKL